MSARSPLPPADGALAGEVAGQQDQGDLISVIVPCYNHASLVGRAIRSVLASDWPNLEVIVWDDGSTDDFESAARVLAADPRVRIFRGQNRGSLGARAQAVMESRGKWLTFLDADDESLPARLRTQHDAAVSAPARDIIFCGSDIYSGGKFVARKSITGNPGESADVTLDICEARVPFSTATMFLSRSLYDALGGFEPSFERVEGHFITKAIAQSCRLRMCVDVGYRVHIQRHSSHTQHSLAETKYFLEHIRAHIARAAPPERELLRRFERREAFNQVIGSLYMPAVERRELLSFIKEKFELPRAGRPILALLRILPTLDAVTAQRLLLALTKTRSVLRGLGFKG